MSENINVSWAAACIFSAGCFFFGGINLPRRCVLLISSLLCGLQFSLSGPEAIWPHPSAASPFCVYWVSLSSTPSLHSLCFPHFTAARLSLHSFSLFLILHFITFLSVFLCFSFPHSFPRLLHYALSLLCPHSPPHICVSLKTNGSGGGGPQRMPKIWCFSTVCVCVCHSQSDTVYANRMSQRAFIISNLISPFFQLLPASNPSKYLQTKDRTEQ